MQCSTLQGLEKSFTKANGRFCDAQGFLDPVKVRKVYMVAGLIAPPKDADLGDSIQKHKDLLNAFVRSLRRAKLQLQ